MHQALSTKMGYFMIINKESKFCSSQCVPMLTGKKSVFWICHQLFVHLWYTSTIQQNQQTIVPIEYIIFFYGYKFSVCWIIRLCDYCGNLTSNGWNYWKLREACNIIKQHLLCGIYCITNYRRNQNIGK